MKPLIRVTQLEKFRRYMSDEYEYETEQGVIDTITSAFQGNEYTRIGTAFHRIVEEGTPECRKVAEGKREYFLRNVLQQEPVPVGRVFDVDGTEVLLDVAQCKTALQYRNEHPMAFHEIRLTKDFGRAMVTGCADMIDGTEIRDIKTKYSTPQDAGYIHSAQWRLYLELFQADTFHFDLFIFEGYLLERHKQDVRGLPLRRHEPITCYRYDGMEQDNANLIDEFIDWAQVRGLTDYLIKQNEQFKL